MSSPTPVHSTSVRLVHRQVFWLLSPFRRPSRSFDLNSGKNDLQRLLPYLGKRESYSGESAPDFNGIPYQVPEDTCVTMTMVSPTHRRFELQAKSSGRILYMRRFGLSNHMSGKKSSRGWTAYVGVEGMNREEKIRRSSGEPILPLMPRTCGYNRFDDLGVPQWDSKHVDIIVQYSVDELSRRCNWAMLKDADALLYATAPK